MSNQYLKLRRSAIPGKIPTTESIDFGEIALNTYDGLAFMKKSGSSGEKVVTIGSTTGAFTGSFSGSFTGSLEGTSSWTNHYNETDPIFVAKSGSFATTGSNTFYGLQTITASNTSSSALDIHIKDDGLWTFRTYNDTYSSSSIGLASWIDNTGISFLGTETDKPLYIYNNADYYQPTLIISSSGVTINNRLIVNNGVTGSFTGSLKGTSTTASYALTASYAADYLPLTGGTINGNVTVNGTASIAFLNVTYESASVIYSSGSNVFGDALNDTQTLIGTVIVSGSQEITGSLSQGIINNASGSYSHAEGYGTIALQIASHAEGAGTQATGAYSHAEGAGTQAIGDGSHAEGESTVATGEGSHAEGFESQAIGYYSHAEGAQSQATGPYSHAEGAGTQAIGLYSHTEGYTTTAIGDSSHAEGLGTVASGSHQHVQGQYNILSSAQAAFIVGNGVDNSNRSNLIYAAGNVFEITGSVNVTGSNFNWNGNTITTHELGLSPHIPYFKTNDTLSTSSLYQSGSSTVIINQDSATSANPEALYVWQPSTSSFNVISGKGNLNNYLQLNIQNTNQGAGASSDVVATANNGSENDNYIDMGINSQNFNGFLGGPNDSYIYTHGHNFWVGNINDGYNTYFFNSSSLLPIITLTSNSARITGSLFGTASWASNAVNATNAANATSASYATNASNAANANYATTAGNGGVTSIIAGSGIALPFGGTGNVTIVAGGGGGGVTIISGSAITSSFVNSNTWTFNHDLGTRTPTITVFDSSYNQIIPQNISLDTTSSATITFPTLESGFAIASTGGTTGTALSSSYSLFSTYAASASYYPETDPIFTAKSGSFATTGSNVFNGAQTINGLLTISGSIIPAVSKSFSLGSTAFPFRDVFISSGSLVIASDNPGAPSTTLSNVNGNILISTGGMQLVGTGSFNAATGSFRYISGSMTQVGNYTQTGNYVMLGNKTITGSFNISGSINAVGNSIIIGSVTATSFTGSLFGTASWAVNTINSSNALTASYVNPLNQAVQITGSLLVTGSTTHKGNITVTGSVDILGSIIMDSTAQTNILKTAVTNPSAYVIHTFPTASYQGASYMFSAIEDSTKKSTTYNVLVAQGNNKVAEIKTHLIKSEGSAPVPTIATAINAGNVELRVTDTGTFTYRGIVQLF